MWRPSRFVGRKVAVALVVLVMLTFALPLFTTENARAVDDDLYLWGIIFDSDGNPLPYDTDFRVWVQHNGTWKGFPSNTTWDPVGTMGSFYDYILPWDQKEINWTDGDLYRIQVDCTPSGDLAENTTSNGTGSLDDPISPKGSYNNEVNWLTGGGLNNSQHWDVVCSNVDLIPTTIEINGQPYLPPMAVAPFSVVTFSAYVTNLGKTDIAEPNTIALHNQSGVIDEDTAVFVNSTASVGPFSLLWNAPESGYFCFNITVDYYDNVTETDETNNDAMVCLSVGDPDLTPSGITITTNYGPQFYGDASAFNYRSDLIPMTPGTSATVVANVTNVGTLASGACELAFYNTTGEGGPIIGIPFSMPMVSPLNPAQSDGPFNTLWTAPAVPGMYYVNVTADYDGDVVEISEINNTFVLRFLVGYPDYIPWNDTLPLVQNVTSNTRIPIGAFVRNVGALDALGDSTIAFYNQTDPSNPFSTSLVPSIVAGQTSAESYGASWLAPIVASLTTYYVVIKVDYNSDILEESEVNNTLVIEFNVFPGPVTTLEHGTPFYVSGTTLYVNSSTTLDFSVQYSAAWVYTMYSIDGGTFINYTLMGQFKMTVEGLHDLDFYSVDDLGNVEATQSQEIIVDDSPPITILNITEPKYMDPLTQDVWVKSLNPATPVYLEWTKDDEPDLAVGRELTSYRVFNGVWGAWIEYVEGNPIALGTGPGVRQIEWYSLDHLGNNGSFQSFTLYVDDDPPDDAFDAGDPNFLRDGELYVQLETDLTITADDGNGCGVGLLEYRIDNGNWQTYTGAFEIEKPGWHTIQFRSFDCLDNTPGISDEKVFVIGPNWKPIIAIVFIIIMIIVGAVVGHKRPLLMARKKQREIEDALLKEEENMEKAGEKGTEYDVEVTEEPAEEEVT